jgi:hypothetical protein
MTLRGNCEAVVQDVIWIGLNDSRMKSRENRWRMLKSSTHNAEKAMKLPVMSSSVCLVPPSS